MTIQFKLASFNVENLFSRAKVFQYLKQGTVSEKLALVDELQGLIQKPVYSPEDKKRILALYQGDLKTFVSINEDRGSLFKMKGMSIAGVEANGAADWDGEIVFKQANFSEMTRTNTAQVIKAVNADVMCIVEVEDRPTLNSFASALLNNRYPFNMVLDSHDPRSIDVGLYSKYPLGTIRTHMFEKSGKGWLFSRDCLEIEVALPGNQILTLLCNHFKSRGYDPDGTASKKRQRQAERVVEILKNYDLTRDLVAVCGDFNDTPNSAALQSILNVPGLSDVLALQYPAEPIKRWTYTFNKKIEQIDFLLVSKPLKEGFIKAGVERRGIADLKKLTSDQKGKVDIEQQYPTVTGWANAASDHAIVWADFKLE